MITFNFLTEFKPAQFASAAVGFACIQSAMHLVPQSIQPAFSEFIDSLL